MTGIAEQTAHGRFFRSATLPKDHLLNYFADAGCGPLTVELLEL